MSEVNTTQPTTVRLPAKTVHKLRSIEIHKLYTWLTASHPLVMPGNSYESIALQATGELGFLVKESNLKDAMQQLELKLPVAAKTADVRMFEKINLLLQVAEFLLFQSNVGHNDALQERRGFLIDSVRTALK